MKKFMLILFSSSLLFGNAFICADSNQSSKPTLKRAGVQLLIGSIMCAFVPLDLWHERNLRAPFVQKLQTLVTHTTQNDDGDITHKVNDQQISQIINYLEKREPMAIFGHLFCLGIGVSFLVSGVDDLMQIARKSKEAKKA